MSQPNKNQLHKSAKGIPYFTPAQIPPPGTFIPTENAKTPPALFKPLTIRGRTFNNRIFVSPMCQYSAEDGHMTDWHLVNLGSYAMRGASLTIIEATSVVPEGRISPEDVGLWKDSQIAPIKRVADLIHSQGHYVGIQLAHAGRKANTANPWEGRAPVSKEDGGWPDNVVGPDTNKWGNDFSDPRQATLKDIEDIKDAFVASAKRSVLAGIDAIDLHFAHGYLVSSFLSPASNTRTDKYGGSFENRTRLAVEIAKAVRAAIPDWMPLFARYLFKKKKKIKIKKNKKSKIYIYICFGSLYILFIEANV